MADPAKRPSATDEAMIDFIILTTNCYSLGHSNQGMPRGQYFSELFLNARGIVIGAASRQGSRPSAPESRADGWLSGGKTAYGPREWGAMGVRPVGRPCRRCCGVEGRRP